MPSISFDLVRRWRELIQLLLGKRRICHHDYETIEGEYKVWVKCRKCGYVKNMWMV